MTQVKTSPHCLPVSGLLSLRMKILFPLVVLAAGIVGAAAQATPPPLAKDSFRVRDGSRDREFVVARDEIASFDAGGKIHSRRFAEVHSASEVAAEAEAQTRATGEEAEIVLYEKDAPRNEFTRRTLTKGILAELQPGTDARSLAAGSGTEYLGPAPSAANFHFFAVAKAGEALTAAETLRTLPGVVSAEPLLARQQKRRFTPNDPLFKSQWHLKNTGQGGGLANMDVNVTKVWDTYKGTGIRLGIVDDGLQTTHPDLSGNVDTANDYDWNGQDNDPNPDVTVDDHGTSCAGVAAGRGNNAVGICGAAPLATLVGLRLIGGPATDADEADAEGYKNDIIFVKSNSWGPDDDGKTLEGPGTLAAAALKNGATTGRGGKGTIYVWAAGNGGDVGDNSNYDGYANSIYTVAVAAMSDKGTAADYSEPGANLVITAPSSSSGRQGITTTDLVGNNGYNAAGVSGELADKNYTKTFGGTSSASPLAAGVITLILQANPNLGWRDVQEILIKSATKNSPTDTDWILNGSGLKFNHKFGAGLINADAAVTLAKTWTNLPAQQSISSAQTGLSVAIPDNNATGISRTFTVNSSLRVEHVTVKTDITHASRGQLEVLLTSPKGTVSRLAEKHTDVGKNYSNWTFMTVRNWGEPAQGVWTLTVRDRLKSTTGTLKAATLTVFGSTASGGGGGGGGPTPGTTKTFTSADVPKAIPDNNASGVTSALPVAFTGSVTAAVLNLNITHTYKGDLKVSLISPGGTEAVVHANAGGSTDNVVLTGFSVPAMVGQAISGTWKIKAVDNAAQDTGSIQSWSLTLTN